MKLTDDERAISPVLPRQMTFEEIVVELGLTLEEVRDFGMEFLERAFAERKRNIN